MVPLRGLFAFRMRSRELTVCSSYRFPELMRFFNARRPTYHTNPRIIDEVIYTPYAYDPSGSRHVHFNSLPRQAGDESQASTQGAEGDLLGIPELAPNENTSNSSQTVVDGDQAVPFRRKKKSKFEEVPTVAEIFLFQYGTVVIWGMTEAEEKRFLSSMCVEGFMISFKNSLIPCHLANVSKLTSLVRTPRELLRKN